MLDDAVSKLIETIYVAPHDDISWKVVLDEILQRTGSRCLLVSAVDLQSQEFSRTLWHGADDGRFVDGQREYESEMLAFDPLLQYAARHPKAGFAESRSALYSMGRSLEDDPYVRWTRGQLGLGHNAVCYTAPTSELTFGLSISLPAYRESFEVEQVRLFRMLFSHLQRALHLAARPIRPDSGRDAVVLLDGRGLVVSVNPRADAMLAAYDGLHLAGRYLVASDPGHTRQLAALIAHVALAQEHGAGEGAMSLPRPSGLPAWLVILDHLPASAEILGNFMPRVMVRIVERPLQAVTMEQRWTRLFGFSATERRLAELVYCENLDLRAAADRLGLIYSTARVHMRHILAKAEVRNQAELMRLFQRLDR